MSIERELLKTALGILEDYEWGYGGDHHKSPEASILNDIRKLLAQPEQEPVTDTPTETAMAVMPNGVCVSNVYDAYEEGRKSVMSEQEPVAWIYEWVDEAGEPVKSVAYNFYDDANPIPLYTAPPKREPLSTKQAEDLWETTFKSAVPYYIFDEICTAIEQYHGIVGGE